MQSCESRSSSRFTLALGLWKISWDYILFILQTISTVKTYKTLLTPRKCFAMSGFSTLNNYTCPQASPSDTCLWRARGRCPRQHLHEGYTYLQLLWPQRKSCPAWMCALHSPGHAICGLPRHWGAAGRRLSHKGRGLREQLSALLPWSACTFSQRPLEDRPKVTGPMDCVPACRMPLFLHTPPAWVHLPSGWNKVPCVSLPGEPGCKDRCAGTDVIWGRLLVPFFRASNSKT